MSKTFKNRVSVRDAESVLEITDTPAGVRITVSEGDGIVSGWFNPDQGAEIALAILEAAGYTEDDTEVGPRKNLVSTDYSLGMLYLRFGIEEQLRKSQANKEAEAKEQAELEAEALELFNTLQVEIHGILGPNWVNVTEFPNIETKRKWLAVARRERELNKEEK